MCFFSASSESERERKIGNWDDTAEIKLASGGERREMKMEVVGAGRGGARECEVHPRLAVARRLTLNAKRGALKS